MKYYEVLAKTSFWGGSGEAPFPHSPSPGPLLTSTDLCSGLFAYTPGSEKVDSVEVGLGRRILGFVKVIKALLRILKPLESDFLRRLRMNRRGYYHYFYYSYYSLGESRLGAQPPLVSTFNICGVYKTTLKKSFRFLS